MKTQTSISSARIRAVFSILAALIAVSCSTTIPFKVRNGSLDLNPRLRADTLASAGLPDGRFYSDGSCTGSTAAECHFISTLRNSLITSEQLQRLRRSKFFWMESDGFPQLSYEIVARNMDLIDANDANHVIGSGVTVGSCFAFPFSDPENRQGVMGIGPLRESDRTNYKLVASQFDVAIQECAAPFQTGSGPTAVTLNPEALAPITNNCVNQSVRTFFDRDPPPPSPNPPLCVINMPVTARMMMDLSYSLTPSAAANVTPQDFQIFWPNLTLNTLPVGPDLKVVPIAGVRTISRRMDSPTVTPNADGSTTLQWTWSVAIQKGEWLENFSPNIVVVKARLRKGEWTAPATNTYLPMTRLDIGRYHCGNEPTPGVTEFAVQTCDNVAGGLNVTPTYDQQSFLQGPVDDDVRLVWKAQVDVPAGSTLVGANDRVSLELDLSAVSVIGHQGAGLLANPPARDLGMIRTHVATSVQTGFTLQNFGAVVAQINSVALVGRDATEFGAIRIHRGTAAALVGTTAPPTLSPPFFLTGGSSIAIDLLPAFQSIGEKRADLVITYEDIFRTPQTLTLPVIASAVTPSIEVLPQQVYFYIPDNRGANAPALERAALLANAGPIPFARQSLSITGPEAGDFRVVRGEFGNGVSDLTQPRTIGPGDAEIYRIGFYPTASGDRHATLTISTSEGNFILPLTGHCNGDCRQPRLVPSRRLREGPTLPVIPQLRRRDIFNSGAGR